MNSIRSTSKLIESNRAMVWFVRRIASVCVAACALLLIHPQQLQAALVSSAGGGVIVDAPRSTFPGDEPPDPIQHGFNEVQDFVLPRDVLVDGGVVIAGTRVSAHMIFMDNGGSDPASRVVTWTFDGPILGVMSDEDGLLEIASSDILGNKRTTYPTATIAFRGLELTLGDGYTITGLSLTQIEVNMNVSTMGDWIRVLTCPQSACITFDDLPVPPGWIYPCPSPCPSGFVSGGVCIEVAPFTCPNGITACVEAVVGAGGLTGGTGKEVGLDNVELLFQVTDFSPSGVERVILRFFDDSTGLSLSVNGVKLSHALLSCCPANCFNCFDSTSPFNVLGEQVTVNVTFFDDPMCVGTDRGIIEIVSTGCIESFGIGSYGQEGGLLWIDDVCLCSPCCPDPADLNCDGVVDAADLAILLGAWGTADPAADLNGDGVVDALDLAILLGAWTP